MNGGDDFFRSEKAKGMRAATIMNGTARAKIVWIIETKSVSHKYHRSLFRLAFVALPTTLTCCIIFKQIH
jgi:hypothetical protein